MDQQATRDEVMTGRLDAAIDRAIEQQRIVGAVVMVARGGRTAYARAAGLADREADRPMREDTLFRLASVTKPIVAAAALALVEAGRMGLDEPVTTWLPGFRPQLGDGRAPDLTVRQLLTHRSGLSYGFKEPPGGPYHRAGVSDGMDQPGLGMAEALERLACVPLLFEPGTEWAYSLALDVLGAAVGVAHGTSLPEAVRALVTDPLGLASTGFTVVDEARLAAAYATDTPRPMRLADQATTEVPNGPDTALVFTPSRAFDPASYPSGGAGMVGTAGDLLAFLEALRGGGAPILGEAMTREGMANQIGTLPVTDWPGWGFGYFGSVLLDPWAGETRQGVGTVQWGGAYGHRWFIDPVQDLSVVSLTNTTPEGVAGPFPDEVCEAVYGPG